jgi:tRNA threonylcarbamoyladenosine biosynthesis protein TsaB
MTTSYLAVEAATDSGSAALITRAGAVTATVAVRLRSNSEEQLMPAIAGLLNGAGLRAADLAGVICGAGPGGFTSLRVSAAIAKGIATARSLPLYEVSSLLLIPAAALNDLSPGRYLCMLDAMRGEFHVQRCEVALAGRLRGVGVAELCDSRQLAHLAGSDTAFREIGPGRGLDFHPDACGAATLLESILGNPAVDTARWEPSYGRASAAEVRREAAARGLGADE